MTIIFSISFSSYAGNSFWHELHWHLRLCKPRHWNIPKVLGFIILVNRMTPHYGTCCRGILLILPTITKAVRKRIRFSAQGGRRCYRRLSEMRRFQRRIRPGPLVRTVIMNTCWPSAAMAAGSAPPVTRKKWCNSAAIFRKTFCGRYRFGSMSPTDHSPPLSPL